MRLFFALDPPPLVRGRMAALQDRLAVTARAVPSANLHATLAFLGEVQAEGIPALSDVAGALRLPACTLVLDRLGAYPRAGVAWLVCTTTPAALQDFQAELATQLARAGFPPDRRPWSPHVTLYRKMRKRFAKIAFEAIDWPLEGFCLMQSEAGDGAPVYHPIAAWNALPGGE